MTNGEKVLVAVIIVLLLALGYSFSSHRSEETYNAWKKANPSVNITYQEWRTLYNASLLYSVQPK